MTLILVILLCLFILMLWFFTIGVASFVTYTVCKKKLKAPSSENLTKEEKRKKDLEKKYTENLYSYNGDTQN